MRSKIPDHVDIVLKEAEVNAQGIVVIQVAESAFVCQLADFLDGTRKQEGVVDHDLQVLTVSEFYQFFGLHDAASERLFNEYMLAVFKCSFGQLVVSPNRGDDRDDIDLGRFQNVIRVGG